MTKIAVLGSTGMLGSTLTHILESEFGWSGVSFDRDELLNKMFENERKNPIVTCDATSVNYAEEFEKYNLPNRIDYLQVDIEPARQTLAALKAIDHQKYRFNVITFETDVYVGGNQDVVKESREMLQDLGYKLVAYHVANGNNPFEDWYVDPVGVCVGVSEGVFDGVGVLVGVSVGVPVGVGV